jgi:hypothetical protein
MSSGKLGLSDCRADRFSRDDHPKSCIEKLKNDIDTILRGVISGPVLGASTW